MSKEPRTMTFSEFATHLPTIFERVIRNHETVVVEKKNGRAVIKPLTARRLPRAKKRVTDDKAFRSAFGAWRDIVEGENLKKAIASERGSNRPTIVL